MAVATRAADRRFGASGGREHRPNLAAHVFEITRGSRRSPWRSSQAWRGVVVLGIHVLKLGQ